MYSVTGKNRVNATGEELFGMLYFAEIAEFANELHSEMETVLLLDTLPIDPAAKTGDGSMSLSFLSTRQRTVPCLIKRQKNGYNTKLRYKLEFNSELLCEAKRLNYALFIRVAISFCITKIRFSA